AAGRVRGADHPGAKAHAAGRHAGAVPGRLSDLAIAQRVSAGVDFCRRRAFVPTADPEPAMHDYVRKILSSSVYEVAEQTPLEKMKRLSERLGQTILLKREDEQPVFSFKIRGAHNRIAYLSAEERARGVICASAGKDRKSVV